MKRPTSLFVGGVLSLSLIAAGSPVTYAATAPTVSPASAEASAFGKNRVKVTLVHDDNDGRVSAGARTVLKGKVTGERAGQTVYLEEKVTSRGKTRWKVIDRIRHNGRFSFTVAPEHGTHEFRARVRTKGVQGTGPVMTRMKVTAPTGGDVTSGSVTVDAATVFTFVVQNSTALANPTGLRNITFNYGVANAGGATDTQSVDVVACRNGSWSLTCGAPGSAVIHIRAPKSTAFAWSITAPDGFDVRQTYYPDPHGINCPSSFFADASDPNVGIIITNPDEIGYKAHVMSKSGSCDVPLYTKFEAPIENAISDAEAWCSQDLGLKILCGAAAAVVAGLVIYALPEAAEQGGEALVEEGVDAAIEDAAPQIDANVEVVDGVEDQGYDEDDLDRVAQEQGYDEDDFNPLAVNPQPALVLPEGWTTWTWVDPELLVQ